VADEKGEDGLVSMTIRFPAVVYHLLKAVSKKDRRAMNQEVLHLIEKAAREMKVGVDPNDADLMRAAQNEVGTGGGRAGPPDGACAVDNPPVPELKTGTNS